MKKLALTALVLSMAAGSYAQTYPLAQQDPLSPFAFTVGGNLQNTRGWRFSVNEPAGICVTELCQRTPVGGSGPSANRDQTLVLWDWTGATALASVGTIPGNPPNGLNGWRCEDIPDVFMAPGDIGLISVNTTPAPGANSYFFSNATPASWRPVGPVQYLDMRFNNGQPATTFPTSVLSPHQYGMPDFGYTVGACGVVMPTGDLTLACGPNKACTDPGQCTATLDCNDGVAVCRDSGGGPVTATCTPTGPYANGTSVTVTCTNGIDTLTEVCVVDVIDAEAPTCGAPAATTVECSAPCGAPNTDAAVAAWLASGTAGDNCPGSAIAVNDDACYAANCGGAEHVVTWIATDAGGYERSCASTLTVVDTIGPTVVDCALPAAPAGPVGPSSATSGPAGGGWLVDCGSAADACSGTNTTASFAVTNTDENCLPVVEMVEVNCGDVVGIEILDAPSCPGSPPAAAGPAWRHGANCEIVLTGESVELVVGATDACGNVGICSTVFVPPPFTAETNEVLGSLPEANMGAQSELLWSQDSRSR